MARPKKLIVDYFPHSCTHRKTMFILEERYGNDGYAFWFKLLEILGNTEGHYFDLNDSGAMEFLQAKTHLSEDSCLNILTLLAKLQAIDPEAWEHKAVWCQKFVDGISDVYKNRREPLPQKPSFYKQKPSTDDISTDENPSVAGVSTDRKPQTKLKETKVNNINNTILSTFEFWNSQNIIKHKTLTDSIKRTIQGTLKNYTFEEIKASISNYAEILKGKEYYFKYRWGLKEFLSRGLEKFLTLEIAQSNYRKQKEAPNGKDRRYPEEKLYTDPDSYRLPVILSTDPAILKLHEDLKGEKPHPPDG